MATAVLVRDGRSWRLVDADRPAAATSERVPAGRSAPEPAALRRIVASAPGLLAGDPVVAEALRAAGLDRPLAGFGELARARSAIPVPKVTERRATLIEAAERALESTLSAPVETAIALAREEERAERALDREVGAAASWLAPASGPLADHAVAWAKFRESFARHHAELQRRSEAAARAVVPNLSAVLGARVAARLLAAAGGLAPLSRMPAPRLQILGARRRPGRDRGPRFGVIFRAEGMESLPPDRQGAFARSLAALAVIAARADATTHADVATRLVARRDRRRTELARRRS